MPLGAEFADRLKAELATDVVFYAGDQPAASSLITSDGRRQPGFPMPPAALQLLHRGESAILTYGSGDACMPWERRPWSTSNAASSA